MRRLDELLVADGDRDAMTELDAAHAAAWQAVDRELLEVCTRRMAMLLNHTPTLDAAGPDALEQLQTWPTDTSLAPVHHAALALTEQYLVDVASITDLDVSTLAQHLGEGPTIDFVNALLVVEQRMRLELALSTVLEDAR